MDDSIVCYPSDLLLPDLLEWILGCMGRSMDGNECLYRKGVESDKCICYSNTTSSWTIQSLGSIELFTFT